MSDAHAARAERLGPYFEVQLRLAQCMAELTGAPLGEMALRHTNLHRRLGFGVNPPGEDGAPGWRVFAGALETAPDLTAQVALSQGTCAANPPEIPPLAGQTLFGCFAHDPPGDDGVVRIHFFNLDTDAEGGPLAGSKIDRRRAELARLVRHVREVHPEATAIAGKSWLYNLDAYRRLFPADYAAARTVAAGPLHLTGTSSWGQLIDANERVRPEPRDALLAALPTLDPAAPWLAFPFRVLSTRAPISSFVAEYGL